MMRRGQRASRYQGSFYYGDLWKFLYEGLPEDTVKFGRTIDSLTVNDPSTHGGMPTVSIGDEPYDLVVVSDGGFSNLRKYVLGDASSEMNSRFMLEPEYAGYVVWRGSVPVSKVPKSVLRKIQEGTSQKGVYFTIVMQQAKDNGEDLWTMAACIETPEKEISQFWNKATDGVSRHRTTTTSSTSTSNKKMMPEWLLGHYKTYLSDYPGLVELMECMRDHGETTPFPQYEFGAIERVHQGRVVITGDAAHMASPMTAVGAHTAILDALALQEAFSVETDDIDMALQRYSQSSIRRARDLYARSKQASSTVISGTNRM